MNRFVYFFEYLVTRLISLTFNLLPFSLVLFLARPVGHTLFLILGKPRRTALENLRAAFPSGKSESEIQDIARKSFVHLAEFGVEWMRMPEMIHRPDRYLLEVNQKEKIYEELASKKKGAIVLVCHTGNWEIMALMGGLLVAQPIGTSVYAVARPLKNPFLYDYAMRQRGGMGLKTIDKSGGVRETFERLKENAIVCILVDQRVSEGSVEIDFFGRPALTTSLPALAALRLGTPIFFNFLHRTPDLRYVMNVEGPVPIEISGNVHRDVQVNTHKFMNRIETEIRKEPARWLWMHNRWRPKHGFKD